MVDFTIENETGLQPYTFIRRSRVYLFSSQSLRECLWFVVVFFLHIFSLSEKLKIANEAQGYVSKDILFYIF